MAEESVEERRLQEEIRRAAIRYRELSDRTKYLADKSLIAAINTAKLQAQTTAATNALRGISNVTPAVRDALNQAAKKSLFLGSALETTTVAVKSASKEFDGKKDDIRRLRMALGKDADTLSGITKLEEARKAAVQARVDLFDKEIKQIDAAIALQNQVIDRTGQELVAAERSLVITETAIANEQALIDNKTALIETINNSRIAQQQEIDVNRAAKKAQEDTYKFLQNEMLPYYRAEAQVKQSLINATNAQIAVVDENIARERGREVGYQSELSSIQARKLAIAAEIGAATTTEQRSALQALHNKELASLTTREAQVTSELATVQASLADEVSARVDLGDTLRAQQSELAVTTANIQQVQTEMADAESEINRLTDAIASGGENMDMLRAQLEAEENVRSKATEKLRKLQTEQTNLIQAVQDNKDSLIASTNTLNDLTEQRQKAIQEEEAQKQKDLNDAVEAKQKKLQLVSGILNKVATELNKLVTPILQLQKQFGLSAGSAAKLKFENLMASANSYMRSLMTGAPGVSSKEIEATQGAFQGEFGGVLTSEAATDLAKEAKRMGVGASEMAKARRVFMTQTMGDTGAAKAAQDKFIGEFAKKGLTAKDAMAAIGQNSELLARNGTRFASSFARAAADAKKIGVDLSKIDQVGDNIIDNFEGFLESQAELGAMGFNFDTSRLAEISETGDTGALMEELRSQLASQGKDLTKLRRSEQLALSKSFGLSVEELQRMAGPTTGAGEETLSPEELQKDANAKLGDLVFRADTIIKILGAIAAVVTLINSRTLIKAALTRSLPSGFGRGGSLPPTLPSGSPSVPPGGSPPVPPPGGGVGGGAMATAKMGAKMGAGAGVVSGLISGVSEYQESGNIKKALAKGLANLAGSIIGGALGSFIPIPGVGTFLGATAGGWAANWLVDKVFADDMISKSGYGSRTLVTPQGPIALNNNDNIVAYADDMISGAAGEGIRMLSYGALAPKESPTTPTVNIDLSRLEQKLDAVVRAIGSMEVKMDGNKVGKVLVNGSDSARTVGVFRQDARATL